MIIGEGNNCWGTNNVTASTDAPLYVRDSLRIDSPLEALSIPHVRIFSQSS